jgi:glutamate decarboxylase
MAALHKGRRPSDGTEGIVANPVFTQAGEVESAPKDRLPDGPMMPDVAYQIVRDEVALDGNARFNLATFVTTWMEPQARLLMAESIDKNMIDKDEYPQTAEIERRCVAMVADLWNAPHATDAIGTSAIGSSEACMLAGMALKRRWQAARRAAGRPADSPNIVFGANVQVVWEKFARYWEVEPRFVPLEGDVLHLTPERMLGHIDENTIAVVGVLGSTFDGSYEPVGEIAAALDDLAASGGPDVPLHVDAASGGFVAPFIQPDMPAWDFRLSRVASISASGHKYGLVYPGVGWVVWREAANVPEDLIFHVNYLGGDTPTLALNFSRPGAQVVAQYYTFLRLGREGYRLVQETSRSVARQLARDIERTGRFRVLTRGDDLPVVAFALNAGEDRFTVYDLSAKLREHGWQVPAYTLPPNREDLAILRIVVRNGLSRDIADRFIEDLGRVLEWFDSLDGPMPQPVRRPQAFHH